MRRFQEEFTLMFRFGPNRHTKRRGRIPVSALEGFWDLPRPTGPPRHELRYDSLLTITDGQLDYHCTGCGGWDSDNNWSHPTPPMCVFSPGDFIDPRPDWM